MSRKIIMDSTDITVVSCDWCGKEDKPPLHTIHFPIICQCVMCGRDACPEHRTCDTRQGGDYPDSYCCECWKIGEPMREAQQKLELEYDERYEKLEKAWRKTAREAAGVSDE